MSDAATIITIAILAGVSCALTGVFLVLRRLAMVGDAISHSVLFGIVVAFLISGSRSPLIMLSGAGAVGLLTAWLTEVLHRHGRLEEGASIGVTFTWLFALGVILISAFAGQIDLDQECVLYGEIAFAPLDRLLISGVDIGPRALWLLGGVTLLNAAVIGIGFRRLMIVSFDPVLARSLGIRVHRWHYGLMALVSLTTVAAFESVGAVLVVAMLVIPANAAGLVARSVGGMVGVAIGIAAFAAVAGYGLAARVDGSIAAAVVVVGGGILFLILAVQAVGGRMRRTAVTAVE